MKTRHLFGALLIAAVVPVTFAAGGRNTDGYIHGTVETTSGNTYRGLLRWGTEETFWDDLFNGSKSELPYNDRQDRADRRDRSDRRGRIRTPFGTIRYGYDRSSRLLTARFGDIEEIRPERGDRARVVFKGGHELTLDGGSNDLGAPITVDDQSLGKVKLEWKRIERIRFSATPRDVRPDGWRLYGTLKTEGKTFEGFIQWDSQECLTTDKLDGDTDDGDVSIEMGNIRRIERRSRSSSTVTLKDGRVLVLSGSNDVNSSNRGTYVEDPRFGRVKVDWDAFESVEFRDHDKSGRGYDTYRPSRRLEGEVTDYDGRTYRGRLVFDLDETHDFEMLNGDHDGIEYDIPFSMIRSIEPGRRDSSLVRLTTGEELRLEDGQDVSERNDGLVIERDGNGREAYVPWRDVRKIEFSHRSRN